MPSASFNPQTKVFAQDGAPSLPLLHQELVECDQECLQAKPWVMLLWQGGCLSQISG